MRFEHEVWVVGAIYFGYFVAALVATVLLAAQPADDDVLEYAYWVVFVTSALHFGFMLLGFLHEGYQAHPVPPEWAFLYADYVMAGALGATIAGYLLDHDNRTPPAIGNAVVMATQVFCALKTGVLLSDVWNGRRDPETGALYQ